MRLIIFLFTLLPAIAAFAQNDTAYTYFDINKKTTQPTGATYVSKTTLENGKWHKQVFLISNGHLYMDGYYADEKTHVPEGVTKYYRDGEKLTDSCFFKDALLKAKYTFYTNGGVKDYIVFADSNHVAEQGGYAEDGRTINNYIVWRPAVYPGGITEWQKYIKKKAKRHQPAGYTNGLMEGTVAISFTIDTTGAVTNAAIVKKSGFIDLDQRALAIIEKSPNWLPAISNNQPVSYEQKQLFIFTNNEVNAQVNKTINASRDLMHWLLKF